MPNILTFSLLLICMSIVFYGLFRLVDRILILIKYKKSASIVDREESEEICSSLLDGACYSTLGDYDNHILVDACQTELTNVCAETSEVTSILVENAGEMTESVGAVVEATVGHVVEALTSFTP
jgi:hypothetical protein